MDKDEKKFREQEIRLRKKEVKWTKFQAVSTTIFTFMILMIATFTFMRQYSDITSFIAVLLVMAVAFIISHDKELND